MLSFLLLLCKFFDSEVHGLVRVLPRPVTRNQTHYDAGTDDDRNDYEGSLDHSSVPCVLPSTTAMTTAATNMPVMMYTKSI